MKKLFMLFALLFLSSFSFFYWEKIGKNNNNLNSTNEVKKSTNEENNKVLVNNYKQELGKKVNLKKECNKVIKWEKSEYLSNTKVYHYYFKSLKVLKNNEWVMLHELKKWNCLKFFGKNRFFCEDVKNKKIIWKKWDYSYSFSKSIIDWKNYCNLINNKELIGDCNETLKFFYMRRMKINNIKLSDNHFKKWYFLLEVWKEKYKRIINNLFYNECIKLKND